MRETLRFLGLDVHAETIAVAIAEPDGEVRSLGTIPNRTESIRKLIKKLGPTEKLRACYEAGPTGYVVYWQLAELGVHCECETGTQKTVAITFTSQNMRGNRGRFHQWPRSDDPLHDWSLMASTDPPARIGGIGVR